MRSTWGKETKPSEEDFDFLPLPIKKQVHCLCCDRQFISPDARRFRFCPKCRAHSEDVHADGCGTKSRKPEAKKRNRIPNPVWTPDHDLLKALIAVAPPIVGCRDAGKPNKTEVARWIGVTLSSVNSWLAGAKISTRFLGRIRAVHHKKITPAKK